MPFHPTAIKHTALVLAFFFIPVREIHSVFQCPAEMEKTIRAINPECDVEVECNDRRGSYGLSPDVQGTADTRYIICDMGSNQLPLARERLGEDVIIIDHHIIEDEENRKAFMSLEPSTHSSCLCNPHALHKDDSQNAQYCATGLAYRVYQESERLCKIYEKPFHTKLNGR